MFARWIAHRLLLTGIAIEVEQHVELGRIEGLLRRLFPPQLRVAASAGIFEEIAILHLEALQRVKLTATAGDHGVVVGPAILARLAEVGVMPICQADVPGKAAVDDGFMMRLVNIEQMPQ